MNVIQPQEWAKPKGFSHGVVIEGPGRWIVLAGQTGDEDGTFPAELARQVEVALQKIIRL
jgi:enamine deaminase RidA (YjgF/YER057c/UK114 family)